MSEKEFQQRFKDWAIGVLKMTPKLPKEPETKAIRNQLVRSAPSAAANRRAASRGKSTADYVNKLKIVEEELDESLYWLEMIVALVPNMRNDIVTLYKEGEELLKMTVSGIKNSRTKGEG